MTQEVVLVQVLEVGLAEEAVLEAEKVAASVEAAEQEVVPVVALEVARVEEVDLEVEKAAASVEAAE